PPLACQWRFNGTNLPGATMPWLLMTNFQPAQTGQYTFVSSNAFGVAESSPATVSLVPLLANAGPTNVLLYSGDVLTATAHGAGPFTYQWFLNDVALADQTNRTLILSGTMTNQPGAYSVLISNSYGSVAAAAPVTTILDSAPFIVTQPQPAQRIAWPGGTVTFLANADGSKTLDYQWLFNGSPLSGATTSTLVLSNLTFNRAGTYSLQAANSFGTAISSNATLTLLSVATWGSTNNYGLGTVPLDLTNDVIAITAGYTHSVALKSNGTVVAWGNNSQGQTSVPANLSNVVAVAAAWSHTVALKADGTVVSWGDRTNVPAGLTNVIAVAAGDFYSMALKADGTVVAWGSGTVTNVPPTVTNVIAIAAGGYFGAALRADRTVIHWTGPTGTTPSGMTNVVAIAANEFPLVALRADGTLAVAGVTPPAGLSNIVAVAAGRYHALALKSDGTVTNWTSPSPVTPAGLRNVQTIASGQEHCLAILGDGPSAAAFAFSGAARQTNQFSFVTPSQYGRIYLLEYKNALGESNWKPLLLHPGVSNSVKLTDASATNAMRFYRVREW
ncbi:MAG TPA: immunoglobulin domain-containing protein, partial [Verrucomicrobiae bacterium]|nr:immunoglobulin domain-containing protein [Verrucomicrobiae bacterium]